MSPLLANVFFDHYLDRPWLNRHPDQPLLRYADDLVVPAHDLEEAQRLQDDLASLAKSAGTPLRRSSAVVDLRSGSAVQWLGFELRWEESSLAVRIGEQSWEALMSNLLETHFSPAAPLRAMEVVRGWLDYLGPCFQFEDHESVATRIGGVAAKVGFDEFGPAAELLPQWERASLRWRKRSGIGDGTKC